MDLFLVWPLWFVHGPDTVTQSTCSEHSGIINLPEKTFDWLFFTSTHSPLQHHLLPPSSFICLYSPASGSIQRVVVNLWAFYRVVVATLGTLACRPDPLTPSTKWPSVVLRENNISCHRSEVPKRCDDNWQCEWHWVTNTLNLDNRKWMWSAQLKAEHTAYATLKLTHLSDGTCWSRGCGPCSLVLWLLLFLFFLPVVHKRSWHTEPHQIWPYKYCSCHLNTNARSWDFTPKQIKKPKTWYQQLLKILLI